MSSGIKLDASRLLIFQEARKRRVFVGELLYLKAEDQYELVYDKAYLRSRKAIPLGPEFDLFQQRHRSPKGKLFPSLIDRIPLKSNPAYKDYCKAQGVSSQEENPIVLLASIGKRGPSSFIFEPAYTNEFSMDNVKHLQYELKISQHDFSAAFDFSVLTLQKIHSGKSQDKDTLRRLQIYLEFPEVALWQLKQTGGRIYHEALLRLLDYFQGKVTLNSLSLKAPQNIDSWIFEQGISYAQQGDFFAYKNLIRETQNQVFENLRSLRKQLNSGVEEKDLDRLVNATAPLFLAVFSGLNFDPVSSEMMSQLLFDLIKIEGWKMQGGIIPLYHLPEFLVYVGHYIYGALCINQSKLSNIFELTKTKIPVYTAEGQYNYLYKLPEVTGSVISLGGNGIRSFQYLLGAYTRWPWMKILFDRETNFQKYLVCYQATMILLDYFDAVKNHELEQISAGAIYCHVPPGATIANQDFKQFTHDFFVKNRAFFEVYLKKSKISKKAIEGRWEQWLSEIEKFRSKDVTDARLFRSTLLKDMFE